MFGHLCGARHLNHATAKYVDTKIGNSVMHCAQHCAELSVALFTVSVLAVILAEDVQ